ncbi:hypothetical protein [Streptomyces olivaceoviridis]|uniref:hypothetical protein n=1 Tax=Streptomyces olivaceoviridis TaxID=1921 RepID=UPI0036BC13B5
MSRARAASTTIERRTPTASRPAFKLGTFVDMDNTRRRAGKLTPVRRAALDQLGMHG